MERKTNNYDVKFGRIRINFDKIEVQPGKYYTRDESDAIFLKVSEITRYIDFNKPNINPTEELTNVYINGRSYKIPETKIDNDTIKKNSEGQLYADIEQIEYIAGKNITLTDKDGNIKEISAGTDEEVIKELESLRDDLNEVDDYAKGHEKRIKDLEGSKLTESDTITIKTDNSINVDLTIDYNSENKHLSLKNKNGNVVSEIDASAFVKDGMLDNVVFETIAGEKYIRFIFNTTSGKDDISIKVSELIDIYEGQGCINITDKRISLKYDSNKLSVNTQGNLTLAEDYLKNISKGTDGTYVTTEISQKSNGNQTIGTSIKVQAISSADEANNGLVEANDVKTYVETQIDNKVTNIEERVSTNEQNILSLQQHEQVNADWNSTSGVSQILNKPNLHAVATSGSYNDLTDKPTPISPTSQCVPYSDNLDSVTDDLSVAWMNTNKESREFGHLYKKSEQIVIERGYYSVTINGEVHYPYTKMELVGYYGQRREDNAPYKNMETYGEPSVGKVVRLFNVISSSDCVGAMITAIETNLVTLDNGYKYSYYKGGNSYNRIIDGNGEVRYLGLYYYESPASVFLYDELGNYTGKIDDCPTQKLTANVTIGGWEDVYDTSTITADITAEVERATAAENELSERIDTKADASTWSNELKQQIDSDHATLSGLSAKWTDILFSQIDADHNTLGTLNTYLSEAKRTSIDDAIAKAHTQNTDTMLNNGTLKVESNRISSTMPIVSSGDIQGTDTEGNTHLLSKKMNSDMIRTYNSLDEIIADTNRPAGCWCAIIE